MRAPLFIALVTMAGCASVNGYLQVEGAPFVATKCNAGPAYGSVGVEFADATGRRVRLTPNPDGTCVAALFPPGSPTGETLGACGVLTMETQAVKVNGVYSLKGTAVLSCGAPSHDINGKLEFKYCH